MGEIAAQLVHHVKSMQQDQGLRHQISRLSLSPTGLDCQKIKYKKLLVCPENNYGSTLEQKV